MKPSNPPIHPGVTSICPVIQKKLFTTIEEFQATLTQVAEAWLRDEKWMPRFLYASAGPGQPITGWFLPSFSTTDDLLAKLTPVLAHGCQAVALLVGCSLRQPEEPRPSRPNGLALCIFNREGLQTFVRNWYLKINSDDTVLSWTPSNGQVVPVNLNAARVFSESPTVCGVN
jgi:hypothetical protein